MTRPKLLVSVRSVAEAEAALAGGADLIDVKEPSRGPLGPADEGVIGDVIRLVNGRAPVSAAMGEWKDWRDADLPDDLTYAKWGLAGSTDVAEGVRSSAGSVLGIRCRASRPLPVLVAYADCDRAHSPDPLWLANKAAFFRFPAFLIDTADKDGSTLLHWISPATLARIRFQLGDAGVPVALAGSLDEAAIEKLLPLAPDWFAVRGAACEGGRDGTVSTARVRRLKAVIAAGSPT